MEAIGTHVEGEQVKRAGQRIQRERGPLGM